MISHVRLKQKSRSKLPAMTYITMALGVGVFFILFSIHKSINQEKTEDVINLQVTEYPPEYPRVPEFSLDASNGTTITSKSLLGKHSLIFFGYTHCPDICLPTVQKLQALAETINEKNRPHILFITIDIENDTPENVANFIEGMPYISGIPADQDQVPMLMDALGIYAEKDDTGILYHHTSGIILTDTTLKPIGYIPSKFTIEELVTVWNNITGTSNDAASNE